MVGKRGPKPNERIFLWSASLAYGIGLFATDGCMYRDRCHMEFTSKDFQQLKNFKKCFNLKTKISFKFSGKGTKCPRIQFGDVVLYKFFLKLGLTPNKSKTIGIINIPREYFFDFFRGVLDGDGSFHSYYDPRWRSSFMFYLIVASASPAFIVWLRSQISKRLGVQGHVTNDKRGSAIQLKYAKTDSLKIIKKVYYSPTVLCLSRKRKKILKALKSQGLDI